MWIEKPAVRANDIMKINMQDNTWNQLRNQSASVTKTQQAFYVNYYYLIMKYYTKGRRFTYSVYFKFK